MLNTFNGQFLGKLRCSSTTGKSLFDGDGVPNVNDRYRITLGVG
jgi:hypothetical protein